MSNELGNTSADKDYKPSGISRAEEKANKRWPIHPWTILPKEGEHGEIINFDEWLDDYRIWVQSFSANGGYKEGYEQAEKDVIIEVEKWLKAEFHHRNCWNADEFCISLRTYFGIKK